MYPSIRIEGQILSGELLQQLEQPDMTGQRPADFLLPPTARVKDEIARAWADAQDYWRIFQRKTNPTHHSVPAATNHSALITQHSQSCRSSEAAVSAATSETRQLWVVPLLNLLGYRLEYQQRGAVINGKSYAISHRAVNRGETPVHVIGYHDPAGLDRKPANATLRMSPHAMMQEYLNLTDTLYGIVTNGSQLRLLRDSVRLVRLTYLEFDLERIFTDGLFADFAILYRLLHASRLPATTADSATCLLEQYHQNAVEQGSRIRDGLRTAVESVIRDFANGFIKHPDNTALREQIISGALSAEVYYQNLLRMIYRFLFLLVIEERNLIFTAETPAEHREIYNKHYSLQRIRRLSERIWHTDRRAKDAWLAIKSTFKLYEADGPGALLSIQPLAGDLFSPAAIGVLAECSLDNDTTLKGFRSLVQFEDKDKKQIIRVNYASLNFEEFGSVYEGLLEYAPCFTTLNGVPTFAFAPGTDRASSGSHYTPDELVQPLLRHSLDNIIKRCLDKVRVANGEWRMGHHPNHPSALSTNTSALDDAKSKALLSLRIIDISCGSGHILLAAARRIATELAIIRTGEEQPAPAAFRKAIREVIQNCIYGVDLNPLAVELCKVALWLEAHNPGEPLNFLDHRIKCGNSIVGYVSQEELDQGVPAEAFKTLNSDDRNVAKIWRDRNTAERKERRQKTLNLSEEHQNQLTELVEKSRSIGAMPERNPEDVETKRVRFKQYTEGRGNLTMQQIAAIPIAQFYLPKTSDNTRKLITDGHFRRYWSDGEHPQGEATALAWSIAHKKRFFHWFLEFPEIMEQGGFDCILGNPPYKGGQHLSGLFGHPFCEYVKWQYAPAGINDLVVYFVRRIFALLKPEGFAAFITTNSIKDGAVRRDGLEQILAQGAELNMVMRSIRWPGEANLYVSLLSFCKGVWSGERLLDNQPVSTINAFFEDSAITGDPKVLKDNLERIFQGSIFLGDGFLLSHSEAKRLIASDPRNSEVIFPIINGQELNNKPDQAPGRSIINFHDWSEDEALEYPEPFAIVEQKVKPMRAQQNRREDRELWWQYCARRPGLYSSLVGLKKCFVTARTTKHLNFSQIETNFVYSDALYVLTTNRWDVYAVVQSGIHELWARQFSGALETRLRYSPKDCFRTYPFPGNLWHTENPALAEAGERYHNHRKELMLYLGLGLTDIYNLFHTPALTPQLVDDTANSPTADPVEGHKRLIKLRELHEELDLAVLAAYGWSDLELEYAFHDIETLPENDRTRYTISPTARKKLLSRLFNLNQTLAEAQDKKLQKPPKKTKKTTHPNSVHEDQTEFGL